MKKYYAEIDEFGWCNEECQVRRNHIMIGSATCQECDHCVDKDKSFNHDWIMCDVIEEAKKTNVTPNQKPTLQL